MSISVYLYFRHWSMLMRKNSIRFFAFFILIVFTFNFTHSELLSNCETNHSAHDYCTLVQAGSTSGNDLSSRLLLFWFPAAFYFFVLFVPSPFIKFSFPLSIPANINIKVVNCTELLI